jgi:hypothetical protein
MAERAGRLRALYAELPLVECQGLCGEACGFIGLTPLERHIIQEAGGPNIEITMYPCPALDFMGRCSVYEYRPMICRLYGVVEDLRCPFGCEPVKELTRDEGRAFLGWTQDLSEGLPWED